MKTTVKLSEFTSALELVNNSIPSRPTNPSLSCCRLENNGGIVSLTGFDLQTLTTVKIKDYTEHESSTSGTILFPPKPVLELCRRLENIEFLSLVEEDNKLLINENYRVLLMPSEFYPELPNLDEYKTLDLPVNILKNKLSFVSIATSNNESKMVLTGVNFKIIENQLKLAASDGYRLAVTSMSLGEDNSSEYEQIDAIVPGKTIRNLIKIMSKQEDKTVKAKVNYSHIQFEFNDITIISRLIDGMYPDCQKIIPQVFTKKLTVSQKHLSQALERLLIFSDKMNQAKFIMSPEQVLLETKESQLGEAKEYLPCTFEGDPLEITFNIEYMLPGLKEMPTNSPMDLVQIQFNSADSVALISLPENDKYLYLVMPIYKI